MVLNARDNSVSLCASQVLARCGKLWQAPITLPGMRGHFT